MNEILKIYFDEYTDLGKREKQLLSDKEYCQYKNNYETLEKKIQKLLEFYGEEGYDLINQLNEEYFMSSLTKEGYSFEYGVYVGMQLGMSMNAHKDEKMVNLLKDYFNKLENE